MGGLCSSVCGQLLFVGTHSNGGVVVGDGSVVIVVVPCCPGMWTLVVLKVTAVCWAPPLWSLEQGILADALLHPLVFGVLHRCSRVCHASTYIVTLCL